MKTKPIKLLFDVSPLANSKKSGVGYYTERLLVALATRYPEDLHIVGHYFNFLDKKSVELPQSANIEYRRTRLFPSKFINIMRRLGVEPPLELFLRIKGDFILYPNFVSYPSLRKMPSATVVHDLGYLDFPEYVQAPNRRFLARYVPRSIKRSRFTVIISEVTKRAVMGHYNTPANKFVLTPIPPAPMTVSPSKPKSINGKFILFIGTLEPRKNFINLVRAYMLLPERVRKEYGLVLAGGSGWHVDKELGEIDRLQKLGENIVTTGYFSEQEKVWLLNNATLFVQPSHLEGFGMPILEAMDAGVPTIVSDIDIFHEVSGDASLYFDQNNHRSIADTMAKVLGNTSLQQDLKQRGHKQATLISWDTIAERLYERICREIE